MAAIDKIYVDNWNKYLQFKEWCEQQPPLFDKYGNLAKIADYLYQYNKPFEGCHPVFNAPCYIDAYVIRNCPFDFIQEELMINYGHWSQKRIKSFYNDVVNWKGEDYPFWAKPEDFITLEDGSMTIKGLGKSDYERVKDGELYTSPIKNDYEVGKHFKCIKHPIKFYNRPFNSKCWFVSISSPDEFNEFMWYHSNHNTWDFSSELVTNEEWSSSSAYVKTIKALKRLIIKWGLPVGTKVKVTGRYLFDEYEFIVKK